MNIQLTYQDLLRANKAIQAAIEGRRTGRAQDVHDVCSHYGQILGNVQNTKWLRDTVAKYLKTGVVDA